MAGEKHVYLVCRGNYVNAALTAEHWQFGVRLWADQSVPADFGTLPSTGDFEGTVHSESPSIGTIISNWQWNALGLGAVFVPWDYLRDQAGPAVKAFIANGQFSSQVRLTDLHLYPITDTGHAFEGRSATLTYASPQLGASTGDMLPSETSVVVSLRTGVPGRRGRGRFYPPPMTETATDSNGFVASATASNLVSQAEVLLSALAIESVSPTGTHVRPIVTGAPWNRYGVVTSCNVGNVFDSQRRRRRQLSETRTSLPITYG